MVSAILRCRGDGVLLLHTAYLTSLALILVAFLASNRVRAAQMRRRSAPSVFCLLCARKKHRGTAFWSPDLSRQKVAEASGAVMHQLQEDSCGP